MYPSGERSPPAALHAALQLCHPCSPVALQPCSPAELVAWIAKKE